MSSNNPNDNIPVTRGDLQRMLRGIQAARFEIATRTADEIGQRDLIGRLRQKISNLRLTVKQLNRAHIILKREHEILKKHYQEQIVEYSKLYGVLGNTRLKLDQAEQQIADLTPMPVTFQAETPAVPEPQYMVTGYAKPNGQA